MEYTSNQFPVPIKQIINKVANDVTQLNDKGKLIILGLKTNCPNLYKYIKAVR